jgi:hypothetical protein
MAEVFPSFEDGSSEEKKLVYGCWVSAAGRALETNAPEAWATEQRWRPHVPWEDRRLFWSQQGVGRLPAPTLTDPLPGAWRPWLDEMKAHVCIETAEEHTTRWGRWLHAWGVDSFLPQAFIQALAELGDQGWLAANPATGESPALYFRTWAQAQPWMTQMGDRAAWHPAHTDHAGNQLWATWLMRVALERDQGEVQEASILAAWSLRHPADGLAAGQPLWSWVQFSDLLSQSWRARNGEPPVLPPADHVRAAVMNQKLAITPYQAVLDEVKDAMWKKVPGRRDPGMALLTQSRHTALNSGEWGRFLLRRAEGLVQHGWHGGHHPETLQKWVQQCPDAERAPSQNDATSLKRWQTVMAALLTVDGHRVHPDLPLLLDQRPVQKHLARGVWAVHHLDQTFAPPEPQMPTLEEAWQVAAWPPAAVWALAKGLADLSDDLPASNQTSLRPLQRHWEQLGSQAEARWRQAASQKQEPETQRRRRLRT